MFILDALSTATLPISRLVTGSERACLYSTCTSVKLYVCVCRANFSCGATSSWAWRASSFACSCVFSFTSCRDEFVATRTTGALSAAWRRGELPYSYSLCQSSRLLSLNSLLQLHIDKLYSILVNSVTSRHVGHRFFYFGFGLVFKNKLMFGSEWVWFGSVKKCGSVWYYSYSLVV